MQHLLDFLWFGAAGRCVRPPIAMNTSASDDARSIRLHQHMALRGKDLQQEIVFPGTPENLMQVVEQALRAGGFTKIESDAEAAMCKGNYHKG